MTRRLVGLSVVLAIAWGGLAATLAFGITPRLGLDLQGGTSVVLTAPEGTPLDRIEVAIDVMRRRIEAFGGVQEPEIAISGSNTVVVQLPGVVDEQRAIEAVGQTGQLSFRPVVDAYPGALGPFAGSEDVPVGIDRDTGLTIEDDADSPAFLLYEQPSAGALVLELGAARLKGVHVAEALAGFDPNSAIWAVTLDLTDEGAALFAELTAEAAAYTLGDPRRQIAIVLDGRVVTAPEVNATVSPTEGITGGRAQITVGRSETDQEEALDLAVVLRYGSLPVAFERSAITKVSGTLGEDSLRSGIIAGLGGLALVAIVLMAVYRSLGLVAIVGLTVFGSLLLTLLALLGRYQGLTLTLAGVTGVIVAIGITADSYIVFFERIKEKIRGGLPAPDAALEGFRLAFRTILTADTVSLLGAGLLWALSVGAVKGFALALGLATILDIFVARTFTRRAAVALAETRFGDGGSFSMRGAAL